MTTYFVAPNPHDDLYVWSEEHRGDPRPEPVVSQFDISNQFLWDKLTFGMEFRR